MLLVTEVDEADEILDDDRPPVRRAAGTRRPGVAALILFVVLAGPIALLDPLVLSRRRTERAIAVSRAACRARRS